MARRMVNRALVVVGGVRGEMRTGEVDEVLQGPQPRMVEAVHKTKWPAQRRPTETEPAREEGACGDGEDEAARAFLKGAELADLLDEVDKAPQPRTVETMCKTEWPAQRRPIETEVTVLTERLKRATMEKAATRVLEGEAAREEVIMSPKGPMASVDEDEAARVHLEGAEPAVAGFAERACTPGPQRFGA
ncbi:hypothetical protein BC826DRAFT_1112230 [Russula brevipes]|nr:hypothetical protein BC826DRAFT_1112230 [Russula brevipes]